MINYNGTLTPNTTVLNITNRGFAYGDSVFETIKVSDGKLLFFEDHYFRLMASMRIMRMDIPMAFTLEFLQTEIQKALIANTLENASARVKLQVCRAEGGLYLPTSKAVDYYITVAPLDNAIYTKSTTSYTVDLFKDYYVSPSLLSTLKTNNKAINIVGSVYAKDNDLDNCLLLNTNKSVIEALNGNLFLVTKNTIVTPPLTDGCLKGVMRKQVLEIIEKLEGYTLEERSISPFELQKADELFITNVIQGVVSITQYRKKQYTNTLASEIIDKLNVKVRLT